MPKIPKYAVTGVLKKLEMDFLSEFLTDFDHLGLKSWLSQIPTCFDGNKIFNIIVGFINP